MNNAIILTNGILHHSDAKTAHGLIRGTERFNIVAVVDDEKTAGTCNNWGPTPWISDAGGGTADPNPGIIWYWVR